MRRGIQIIRAMLVVRRSVVGAAPFVMTTAFLAGCADGQTVGGARADQVFHDVRVRALAVAAARGDAAEVSTLAKAGASPNAAGRDGLTPLLWAVGARNDAGVRALLAAGADPNVAVGNGPTPLAVAAALSDPTLLRLLLDAKGDPNARNSDGQPLLHTAILNDRDTNVRLLVERGADVNAMDAGHTSPALLAASTNRWDLVGWLVEHGADPLLPDLGGGTVANSVDDVGGPSDAPWKGEYARVRGLLMSRGVQFPAEDAATVRRRVYGPNNPIDLRIARESAARSARTRDSSQRGTP